jgi:hypothetical protein
MKKLGLILVIVFLSGVSCKTRNTSKEPKRDVKIAINISAETSASTNFIHLDYYRFQVLTDLEQFQRVNFDLVEMEDNPEVVLNLKIENFTLWPWDERVSRRIIRRNIIVGTDSNGKPIYQTVSASVDIIQAQRRSNARFISSLTINSDPPFKFQRTFTPHYNYVETYIDNIQGDTRALDASISMARGRDIEPMEDDFLLFLSKQEMLRRLGDELRKYYDTNTKAPEIK